MFILPMIIGVPVMILVFYWLITTHVVTTHGVHTHFPDGE